MRLFFDLIESICYKSFTFRGVVVIPSLLSVAILDVLVAYIGISLAATTLQSYYNI